MSQPANISNKLDQLKESIDWFYSEDFELSKALENYQKAATLAKDIEKDLSSLKNKIDIIAKDFTEA